MKKFPWLMVVVFVVVLLVAFAVAMPFFTPGMRVGGVWGRVPGHMGAWGMMGSMPFHGGAWMIGGLLTTLAVLALAVVGAVVLIRALIRAVRRP